MRTTTLTTPFPPGLINEVFSLLPYGVRINMILNWAKKFADPEYESDLGIVEIIKSITLLDFSHYLGIKEESFCNLVHLPFSSSLTHLNLSQTPIGKSPALAELLGHPIFQHLMMLNLHDTKLKNINPLLNAPHQFLNLHTLILYENEDLDVPTIATTTQFPNLKVLDMNWIPLDTATIQRFSTPPTTTAPPPPTTTTESPTPITSSTSPPPFQLESLSICGSHNYSFNPTIISSLSRSPHLTQLKELHFRTSTMSSFRASDKFIQELFDPVISVLKNLTVLEFSFFDSSGLAALGQSPLLSNLSTLKLKCRSSSRDPLENATHQQYIQTFINSPYLWGPQLKHLSLRDLYLHPEFVFDDLIPVLDAANVKLETLDIAQTFSSLAALSSASCLTSLKQFVNMGRILDPKESGHFDLFTQSPILSNLETLTFNEGFRLGLSSAQWVSLLSSPMMSNNLTELDLSYCEFPMVDVIKTLCTQRVIPDDETSPLKYGKLKNLNLAFTQVTAEDIGLIVENLTQLTDLGLGNLYAAAADAADGAVDRRTIVPLLSTETANPCYPDPALPNLVHLDLSRSSISPQGFIQLSKSQLLDQLEWLDVGDCPSLKQHDDDEDLPPSLYALLTSSRVSNLKRLDLKFLIQSRFGKLKEKDNAIAKYLDHCWVRSDWY